jgi:hypothetical protein
VIASTFFWEKSLGTPFAACRGGGKPNAQKGMTINTGTDKRFVRRDKQGQFKESDDVGRSLAVDRRQKAKAKAKPGHGDKGDR